MTMKINYIHSKRSHGRYLNRKEITFESTYTTLTTKDNETFHFLSDKIRSDDGRDYILSPVSVTEFFTDDLDELKAVVNQRIDCLFKALKINLNKEIDRFAVTRHAYLMYRTMGSNEPILPPGYFRNEFAFITPLESSLAKSKMFISFIQDTGMFVLNDMKANAHTTMHHSRLEGGREFYDMLHLNINNAEELLERMFDKRES